MGRMMNYGSWLIDKQISIKPTLSHAKVLLKIIDMTKIMKRLTGSFLLFIGMKDYYL